MCLKKVRTLPKNNEMMSIVRCIPNQEILKCEKNMHYRIKEICSRFWGPDLQGPGLQQTSLHWWLDSEEEAWLVVVLGTSELMHGKTRLEQSVRPMASCHCSGQHSYSCLVLLWPWKGKWGWEMNKGISSLVGSGYASHVGWGESVFLLLMCVWRMHNIVTEHPGATWCSFLFSETPFWTTWVICVTCKLTQKSSVWASLLVSAGWKLQNNGIMGSVAGDCLPGCGRGAPSGRGDLVPPQAHMGSVNNEAGAAARSSALGESMMERIEGNVGGEPEGAACRQEAGNLQWMGSRECTEGMRRMSERKRQNKK